MSRSWLLDLRGPWPRLARLYAVLGRGGLTYDLDVIAYRPHRHGEPRRPRLPLRPGAVAVDLDSDCIFVVLTKKGPKNGKKRKRKPPSLGADGRVVEVGGFPSPAHPSVAGLRVRGAFRDASDAPEAGQLDEELLVDDGAGEVFVDAQLCG